MTRIRRGQALPETHAACEQTPASRVVHRTRAAVADRRGRATEQCARGRTSHGRGQSPECSPPRARRSRRRARGAGEGNFSSLQTLENKRNRIGIPPNPPPFRGRQCYGGDYLAEPKGVATRLAQGRSRAVRNRNDGEHRRFRVPVNPSHRAVHAPWRRVLRRKTAFRSDARRRPAVRGGRSHCAYSPS
jgi:hypothetical protein